jgi:hypothetical protein
MKNPVVAAGARRAIGRATQDRGLRHTLVLLALGDEGRGR